MRPTIRARITSIHPDDAHYRSFDDIILGAVGDLKIEVYKKDGYVLGYFTQDFDLPYFKAGTVWSFLKVRYKNLTLGW